MGTWKQCFVIFLHNDWLSPCLSVCLSRLSLCTCLQDRMSSKDSKVLRMSIWQSGSPMTVFYQPGQLAAEHLRYNRCRHRSSYWWQVSWACFRPSHKAINLLVNAQTVPATQEPTLIKPVPSPSMRSSESVKELSSIGNLCTQVLLFAVLFHACSSSPAYRFGLVQRQLWMRNRLRFGITSLVLFTKRRLKNNFRRDRWNPDTHFSSQYPESNASQRIK